jgi:nicotinamide riboside kinase
MKLAISGSAGTGKTMLAKALADVMGWPYIPEFVREACVVFDAESPRDVPLEKGHEFQRIILDMKREAESKHMNFVADRSTADNLAYYLWWNARSESLDPGYLVECRELLKVYDVIYFLEWGAFDIVDDGFRSVNAYYQLAIHSLIKGILVDCGVPYLSLKIADHQNRFHVAKVLTEVLDKDRNAVGLFVGKAFRY